MKHIYMIITNSGDGSNSIDIIRAEDEKTMNYVERRAEDGDERYASGDGLQRRTLSFPDDFDVDTWVEQHFYGYTTMKDFE